MNSSKLSAFLLISLLSISAASLIVDPQCGYCSHPHPTPNPNPNPHPHPHPHPHPKPPTSKPPTNLPPTVKPPVTVPKVPVVPPKGQDCPPPAPAAATCPVDSLKLGACVDLLGGLIHVGLGDPATNQCCPLISGLVEIEAAVCLCTALKIKALNLNIYVPLALQLLLTCGKTPPPGYTCSL